MHLSIASEHGDRHFNGDHVHIEPCYVVTAAEVPSVISVLFRCFNSPITKVKRIKCRSKINIEGVISRSGKNANSIVQSVDTLLGQGRIVRHSPWANVRWDGKKGVSLPVHPCLK